MSDRHLPTAGPGFAVTPLFLLMGSFATASGLPAEIYRLPHAFVGHRRGGLAIATMGGCALFSAVCGSSPATAATFGRVALPQMLDRGYTPPFATGCIVAGGTLGALVPPSIIAVVFHGIAITVWTPFVPEGGPAGHRIGWAERVEGAAGKLGGAGRADRRDR